MNSNTKLIHMRHFLFGLWMGVSLYCVVGCNSLDRETDSPTSVDLSPSLEASHTSIHSTPTTQNPTITPVPSATITPGPNPTITPVPGSTSDISVCPGKRIIYSYNGLRVVCFDQDQVYFEHPLSGVDDNDNSFAISPNKELVAFATDEGIRITDLEGNEIAFLPEAQHAWTLIWSPDAEYIAYIELVQGTLSTSTTIRMKFIHVATQTVSDHYVSSENLGFSTAESFLIPRWSPDGQKLVLINGEFGELYVMDVNCDEDSHMCIVSNAINVPCSDVEPDRCYRYEQAAWAPDSERLVVVLRKPYDGDYEGYEFSWVNVLRIIDFTGAVIEEINPLDYDIMMPGLLGWVADGQEIMFFAYPPVGDLCTSIYVWVLEDTSIYQVTLGIDECSQSVMWIRQ